MNKDIYKKSNIFQEKNGWIYGHFMPEGLAKDKRIEIKVAKLDNSFTSDPHYNKTATKIDIVWSGNAIWEVEGKEIEMKAGDYLVLPPGTTVCIKKVLSPELIVQTIKFPSIPHDKVMVNK
jgi:quercetin dioxygenase-like cupin family protein